MWKTITISHKPYYDFIPQLDYGTRNIVPKVLFWLLI